MIETNKHVNEIYKRNTSDIFIWQRYGKCNWKQCQSACCRFNVLTHIKNTSHPKEYHKMQNYHSETIANTQLRTLNRNDIIMFPRLCPHIKVEGGCMLHGKRTQPNICRYFPMNPNDGVYVAVKHVCGYNFKKVRNKNYVPKKQREIAKKAVGLKIAK